MSRKLFAVLVHFHLFHFTDHNKTILHVQNKMQLTVKLDRE